MNERFPASPRWFDPFLIPTGEPLQATAATLLDHLECHEAAVRPRDRVRRPTDQAIFRTTIDITTANLALAVLGPSSSTLAVRRGHSTTTRTRYDHPALGKRFAPMLDRLAETGFADQWVSDRRGTVSTLTPTAKFADLIRSSGVTFEDFGRSPEEECIVVTEKIERENGHTSQKADYKDTAASRAMRAKLKKLNAFLAAADITFEARAASRPVDDRDRRLTRHFPMGPNGKPSFDKVGRLFGGFWMGMPSAQRHGIRIAGEPATDLDYSSMFVRLAYAELGRTPPDVGDLYALPGLEGYRSGVKLAMNALFWDDSRGRKSWPKGMGVGVGDDASAKADPNGTAAGFEGRLPAGWGGVTRLKEAITAKHPDLAPAFGRALGGTLMFRESQILTKVLEEMMDRGIIALPLHDGLLTSRSQAGTGKSIMERVARDIACATFPVVDKAITSPSALTFRAGQATAPSSFHL